MFAQETLTISSVLAGGRCREVEWREAALLHMTESVTLMGKGGRVAVALHTHTLEFTLLSVCLPETDLRKTCFPSVLIKS